VVLAVRPAPPLDPPLDDRPQPPGDMDLLPVAWPGAGPPPRPPARARRRAAPDDVGATAPEAPPPPPITRPTMPARAALQRYVAMCIEVLNGYRASAQLRPLTDVQQFTDIAEQLARRTVRRRLPPGRAALQGRLIRVRRLIVTEPVTGVAEAAVVLTQGDACWAMAVRMEHRAEGWRCAVVEMI
jgi:hypothetical protein